MQRKSCKNGLERRLFRESSPLLLAALKTVTIPTMGQFPNLNTARRAKEDQFQNFQNPRRKAKVPVSEFSIQSESLKLKMLIVKLTRTQILQQERKVEEEKQKLKTARKSVKPKAAIKTKTTVNVTQTNVNVTQNNTKKGASTETLPKKILSPNNSKKYTLVKKVTNAKIPRTSIPKIRVTRGKTNNRNTKPSVGVRFRQVKVTKRKSPVRKVARKGKLRPRVVSKAVPKKKVGTGKPTVPAQKPINGSKPSATAKFEKEGKTEEEKKQVEKVEKKTTDCCCSEKDGEEVQSCWMCRLSQRLGGKLIGNKIKTK